jgi:hypothetical protein
MFIFLKGLHKGVPVCRLEFNRALSLLQRFKTSS